MPAHMHLGWYLAEGVGPDDWRTDRMPVSVPWDSPEISIELAKVLERTGFEFLILGDHLTATSGTDALPRIDPAVLAPMLTMHTSSLGIVPTLNSSYYPPFLLARLLGTLDHVTHGRIGWNLATSAPAEERLVFGSGTTPASTGTDSIADEYVDVVRRLWTSWDADAVVEDVASGTFADPSKVRMIHHEGEHFRVRGPLNVVPGPQLQPPLMRLVTTDDDARFAGAHADVALLPFGPLSVMDAWREKVLVAASNAGRDGGELRVMYVAAPVVSYGDRDSGTSTDVITGTPDHIADVLEAAFDAIGGDGFVLRGTFTPGTLTEIATQVVGLLRQRGRVAPISRAQTLRTRLLAASTAVSA